MKCCNQNARAFNLFTILFYFEEEDLTVVVVIYLVFEIFERIDVLLFHALAILF